MWLQKFIGKVIGERLTPLQRWYSAFCQMVNRIIYRGMLSWWIKTHRTSLLTNQMFFCKMTGCHQISTVVWVMVQPWESTFWPDDTPPPHLFFTSLSFSCATVRKMRFMFLSCLQPWTSLEDWTGTVIAETVCCCYQSPDLNKISWYTPTLYKCVQCSLVWPSVVLWLTVDVGATKCSDPILS